VRYDHIRRQNVNVKILFYNKFIICLYMFRALLCSSFDVSLTVHLSIISVTNQLDAQNLVL